MHSPSRKQSQRTAQMPLFPKAQHSGLARRPERKAVCKHSMCTSKHSMGDAVLVCTSRFACEAARAQQGEQTETASARPRGVAGPGCGPALPDTKRRATKTQPLQVERQHADAQPTTDATKCGTRPGPRPTLHPLLRALTSAKLATTNWKLHAARKTDMLLPPLPPTWHTTQTGSSQIRP